MLASFLQTASVVIAAISVAIGVTAWRRSALGQKRFELAERVYELFLEARDAFSHIRSPFGYGGEGSTRNKREGETEEETQLLNNAYVAIERYNNKAEVFSKLIPLKHRFSLYFGKETAEPFTELTSIINEIFLASRQLSRSWRDQGRSPMSPEEFEKHLERMHRAEGVFWEGAEDPDLLKQRIDAMVAKIERTCESVINPRRNIRTVAAGAFAEGRSFLSFRKM
ncbi:hypothetical protein [Mesorhizobium sp. M7A.F.Ca.MR.245.00.0.0]|uniref:hypothetical protein n=1 Tax=Mesorhizobium sp. M7A.F.Ca.MR.245.00.0.0 TaxID=2496778 RepID=UPI000FC9E5BE|nr:hypothetical protein [Mesorhizobium sp. M7A.F.Ca.MR.245.00.0.0]RUV18026.1 hypothetical protein EOB80_24960 [Mesorhizobium sp. M7A.F.Ca.MR.245.00.0.0]RUV50739.1 hypothetical protein EOB77_13880 [Mesorhizobium sp. M7A.F.Ca.MR.228.00.0.0]